LGKTETRARVMLKSLRNVEALPDGQAVALIAETSGDASEFDDDADADAANGLTRDAAAEDGVRPER
jgi:DNA recombination protein RmuC